MNLHILDRARTDSFALLRLMNIQAMAIAMLDQDNFEALDNFCIEWLPLRAYLDIDLSQYQGVTFEVAI